MPRATVSVCICAPDSQADGHTECSRRSDKHPLEPLELVCVHLCFRYWFYHVPMSTRSLHGITSSAVSEPVFQTLVLPPPSTTQIRMSMLQTLLGSVPPHKNHSSDTGTITANKLDPAPKETPPIMTFPIGERKIWRIPMTHQGPPKSLQPWTWT